MIRKTRPAFELGNHARLRYIDDTLVWEFPEGMPGPRYLPILEGGDNTFITPDTIAKLAYANLYETVVMAQLVHRDYDSDFNGAVGDTVTIRKPAVFTAQHFTGTIDVQNATEQSVPVTLDTHLDVSFAVTAKQLALQISQFNTELIIPAVTAIRQGIDKVLMDLRDDITQEVGTVTDPANDREWNNPRSLISAGTVLDKKNVPVTGRSVVVGPTTSGEWLGDPLMHQAQQRGDTAGLQEANLGPRLFGFDPYMSQAVGQPPASPSDGDESTEVNVAFHETAFALVSRVLPPPQGVAPSQVSVFNDQGFGIRCVQAYDIVHKTDTISLDILVGGKTLDADRACLIKGEEVGTAS